MPVKKTPLRRRAPRKKIVSSPEAAVLRRIYGDNEEGLQAFTRPTSRAWIGVLGVFCTVLLAGEWWLYRAFLAPLKIESPVPVVEVRFSPEAPKPGELVRVQVLAHASVSTTAERLEWVLPIDFHPATSTEWRSIILPTLSAGAEWSWSGEGILGASPATSSAFTLVRLRGGEASSREPYMLPRKQTDVLQVRLTTSTAQNPAVSGDIRWQMPDNHASDLRLRVITSAALGTWNGTVKTDAIDRAVPATGSSTALFWPTEQGAVLGEIEMTLGRMYGGEFVSLATHKEPISFAKPLVEWATTEFLGGSSLVIGRESNEILSLSHRFRPATSTSVTIEQMEWSLRALDPAKAKRFSLIDVRAPFLVTTSTKANVVTIRSETLSKDPVFKSAVKDMDWTQALVLRGSETEAIAVQMEQRAVVKDRKGKKFTIYGPPITINILPKGTTN